MGVWREADFTILLDLMRRDPDANVRKEAAWTLRRVASPATWRALFEHWKADPLPRHRPWACELAVQLADRAIVADLQQLADDRDGHVRQAALRALRALAST